MPLNVVEILERCRLFAAVGPRGFQQLAVMARLRSFDKGQIIFREGEPCPGVFVVGSGLVRVFKLSPSGKEHVLHLAGPGESFAEVAAIGGFDLPASAEALQPTCCAFLPRDPLRRLLDEDHEVCREMLDGMARWVRHLVTLLEDIVFRDAAGRLARYLLQVPANADDVVALPALKRHLANHLNFTSETFSRTLRRLVDAGVVAEVGDTSVKLLDRHSLARIANGEFPLC
jgi:CRP/FNR family transcriptional regulator